MIVDAAHLKKGETVLEIGPGKGVLTRALLDAGAKVVAVETDADMIAILEQEFKNEVTGKQLTLVHGNILNIPIDRYISGAYKLVANIPYYITGEILRSFLSRDLQPKSMVLLLQKEVAERIIGIPCTSLGTRSSKWKESVLSLSVKCYGTPRYVKTISARYFNPPPKVDSAIIHIDHISKDFFKDFSEEQFFEVVKAGFSSKRKKLINNLSSFGSKNELQEMLLQSGIPKDARAEDVPLDQWKVLVNNLV